MPISLIIPADKLFGWCWPEPGRPERRTLQNLQDDWDMLNAARDHTNAKIQESRNMRTLPEVTRWLQQVESLGLRVQTLTTDYTREYAKQCFYGCFPKYCKNYFDLWKQISPMDHEVLHLLSQKKEVVAETPLVPSAQRVPTDSTTPYIQKMLDQIWIHVENEQGVGLIGLYGMGGVGKTTILKAIHNKLCSSTQLFDLQLGMIVVSKTPNLDAIQNDVGKKIGFRGDDWKIKSPDEKAQNIFNVLLEKKYILLLDDIWERFDLTKIGISHECLKTKSKVIFTTRFEQVCGQMQGRKIQVKCLLKKEAWDLFQEKVGEETLNKAHPDILELAKDVARECGGLPLAVIVVGRAMTCKKTKHEWEHAIRVLKKGNVGQSSTMMDEVFTPLKYSFYNLPNETIRSCLLYCSLYPEDHFISKSEMIEKWICEDFWGGSDDPHKDRINEGHDIIRTLVNACLLEESIDCVRMHDVIRDMMIHIGGNKYCVKAGASVTQIPNDVKWEHVERMSLMNNPIVELDGRPTECPNLKTMFLADAQLSSIKIDFSKFVPNLKVLDLSVNLNLTSLPNGICELVHLEYLNLWQTNIQEIPVGLKKLVRLKYLNMVFTQISEIQEGILSSLKQLYVFRWAASTNVSAWSRDFLSKKLVKELEGLSYLQDLSIAAHSKVDISHLTSSVKLLSCITKLTLIGFNDSNSLNILFLREMKHLDGLAILDLEKVEKIMVEDEGFEISAMNFQNGVNTSLQYLAITSCRQLKNLSWLVLFPNIKYLDVRDCPEMQTLVSKNEYNLDKELQPFTKIVELYLDNLPKLENIYVTPLLFALLRHLEVGYDCNRLKKLPLNSITTCESGEMEICGHQQWWDELQWEDEATRITFSPSFVPFLHKSEVMFPYIVIIVLLFSEF